ncbi:MAG: hypothetical protein RJA22_2949 [Verrucomicrobiota bacterium]
MLTIRPAAERGHAEHGWLQARHTFSFAEYQDPRWMGFRSLRVINDDLIAGGGGFGMHPHRDMEILTWVLRGALEHRDSMGHHGLIRPGEFQYMAAGTGVQHSESNPSATESVRLLQIWMHPDRRGHPPAYAHRSFAAAPSGRWHVVASPDGRDASMAIHQDAQILLARLAPGETLTHRLAPGRHAWAQMAEGEIDLNGECLRAGDGAMLSDVAEVNLSGIQPAQLLLFDLA